MEQRQARGQGSQGRVGAESRETGMKRRRDLVRQESEGGVRERSGEWNAREGVSRAALRRGESGMGKS